MEKGGRRKQYREGGGLNPAKRRRESREGEGVEGGRRRDSGEGRGGGPGSAEGEYSWAEEYREGGGGFSGRAEE